MIDFNYTELLTKLSNIEIKLEGDEVATYYNKRQTSRTKVSNKYEIFDFRPFVIRCINEVQKNYTIDKYTLSVIGGRQEIRLFSEPEIIDGKEFRRTFYLLNSSDKSRALSFSYGLKYDDFHFVSKKGTIYKKHYTGITSYVDEHIDLDDTIFQEQIEVLEKIIGDTIYMSDVQKVITESEILDKAKVTLKNNFDKFRDLLYRDSRNIISESDREKLKVSWLSKVKKDYIKADDFMIDSFLVFKTYLKLFIRKDAGEIKRESERISKLGVLENRKNSLDSLLIF